MALKVIPAGDERCDIHNKRKPPTYICKDCLEELGGEEEAVTDHGSAVRRERRTLHRGRLRHAWRALGRSESPGRRRILIGAGMLLVIVAIVVGVVLAGSGDGGGGQSGLPTEEDVVNALDLSPDPSGTGWITLDGSCAILSIEIGKPAQSAAQTQPANTGIEASNEDGTVRAVVQNAFSQSQTACVDRINAALRDHF
jgi:hypothetical protein